jgi:hypothetical protein
VSLRVLKTWQHISLRHSGVKGEVKLSTEVKKKDGRKVCSGEYRCVVYCGSSCRQTRRAKAARAIIAAADSARILTDADLKDEAAVSAWLLPKPEDRGSAATSGM